MKIAVFVRYFSGVKTLLAEYIIQHCSQHLVQNNELNRKCILVVFIKKPRTDTSRSTSGGVPPRKDLKCLSCGILLLNLWLRNKHVKVSKVTIDDFCLKTLL